jgi:hypothetical protein
VERKATVPLAWRKSQTTTRNCHQTTRSQTHCYKLTVSWEVVASSLSCRNACRKDWQKGSLTGLRVKESPARNVDKIGVTGCRCWRRSLTTRVYSTRAIEGHLPSITIHFPSTTTPCTTTPLAKGWSFIFYNFSMSRVSMRP